ncbi:hypothetical protein JXQ31_18800 [candidate division KSB1 bacterium]|nr:hypothetical protein [candidate division KSB1 bacterium]
MAKFLKYFFLFSIIIFLNCEKDNATNPDKYYDRYSGRNLQNWSVNLGDSLIVFENEQPISANDIRTLHYYEYTSVEANINHRGIQAHNLTFKQINDAKAVHVSHHAVFYFNLPLKPSRQNKDSSVHAVECGLFIRDGSTTQKQFGVAFRWIVNPWRDDLGRIYVWDGDEWQPETVLQPDSLQHTVTFILDKMDKTGSIQIDNHKIANAFSETSLPDSVTGISTILQFGVLNPFPPEANVHPAASVYFKNWKWEWLL